MKKIIQYIWLITFFLVGAKIANAQVDAGFTMSNSMGCGTLDVDFTNTSTPVGGNITYLWNFGVPGGTSTLMHPSWSFGTHGVFTVKLVVTNTSTLEKDSITDTVTVYEEPVANFSSPQQGCVPFTVPFTDLSAPGDAAITTWNWDFREGYISHVQNPVKTYNTAGNFGVFLEVIDAHGCHSSIDRLNYIDAGNPVVALFTSTMSTACIAPANVQFINYTTGPGSLSYSWNFGGLGTSTNTNPNFIFNSFGSYQVRLIASSNYGCSDTFINTITIGYVEAIGQISQDGDEIHNNDIVCPGRVDYSSTPLGTNNVKWLFGDGQVSLSRSGYHDYTTAGNYTVRLIALPGSTCADTILWNITVDNITVMYSMSSFSSCVSPVTVNFTDLSTNVASRLWNFDDGQTSTQQNPSHVYSLPAQPNPYVLSNQISFMPTLIVTSENGCTLTSMKLYTIKKPVARFVVDNTMGCEDLLVNFTDKSISDDDITNWQWIHGDGTLSNSSVGNSSHTYLNPGDYNARLLITDEMGCQDTSYSIPVQVGRPLILDFSMSPVSACPNTTVQFTDLSADHALIDGWHYFVEDISVEALPGEDSPSWIADCPVGANDVTLTASYNGCVTSYTRANYFTNQGPESDFDYSFNCNSPLVYNFTSQTSGTVTSRLWQFGDGQTSASTNPSHTYAADGNYTVKLIANSASCSDTATQIIKVRTHHPVIDVDPVSCAGSQLPVDATGTFTMSDACREVYFWDFGTGVQKILTSSPVVYPIFPGEGNYTIKLVALYDDGCKDSTTAAVSLFMPTAAYTSDINNGCTPITVHFTDGSAAGGTYPLVQWRWDFDDGTVISTGTSNSPTHLFSEPGLYQVELTVWDQLGCQNTHTDTISTAVPSAYFTANPRYGCTDKNILFTFNYADPDSAIWNFGDGNIVTDTANAINHAYENGGGYQISLTVYKYGCSNSYTSSVNYVNIQQADASFTVSDSIFNCYPRMISFTHQYPQSYISSGVWQFGYGGNNSDYAVTREFIYAIPGDFTSSLSIITTNGCSDTVQKVIRISGPVGQLNLSTDAICIGDAVTLSISDTNDVRDFRLFMGDGASYTTAPVTYIYDTVQGWRFPSLSLYGDTLINDADSVCMVSVRDSVNIVEARASYNFIDSLFCDQYDILFNNTSSGNTYNYWDFGDGSVSNEENPVKQFSPGTYHITLIVAFNAGCADTTEGDLTIYPVPEIIICNDTIICRGDSATIWAQGGDAIQWTPVTDLSNPQSYTTYASPENTITYTATVTYASSSCYTSDSVVVAILQAPDITVTPSDTSILLGARVYISADSLEYFNYIWSPTLGLSCSDCASPVARPLESTPYTLRVSDIFGCYDQQYSLTINVNEVYSLELPTVFTPNEDDANDIIYVKGGGIERLLEFRIFNRWGNEVFFTDDLTAGWDGTFKGKPQNIDTYAYYVKVEMVDGRILEKRGTFLLVR